MSEERDITEYIDAYLDDTLTGIELESFRQKMQQDPGFRHEVEAQQAVRLLVEKTEKRAFFKQLEEELFNTTALIDRYLEENMSESEREWFEEKLGEDQNLQQEVEAQRMIIEAVRRQEAKKKFLALEKEVEENDAETQNEAPVIPLNNQRNLWMAIAASVAIIISVVAVFFLNQPEEDQLVADYSIDIKTEGTALGYAGEDQSMSVLVIKSEKHPYHYTLQSDTLKIFLENPAIKKADIQLQYDPSETPPYRLRLKNQAYFLDSTSEEPQPLEAIR